MFSAPALLIRFREACSPNLAAGTSLKTEEGGGSFMMSLRNKKASPKFFKEV